VADSDPPELNRGSESATPSEKFKKINIK